MASCDIRQGITRAESQSSPFSVNQERRPTPQDHERIQERTLPPSARVACHTSLAASIEEAVQAQAEAGTGEQPEA